MIYPPRLRPGDRIAIISPATTVKPEYIDGAVEVLRGFGFDPLVLPHAKGPADGSYAASLADRLTDFQAAMEDASVKAILCARGGYGSMQLLPHVPADIISRNPKWIIGFSDISALHAFALRSGVASIHASMAKHLAEFGADDSCTRSLLRILTTTDDITYRVDAHPYNRLGHAEGRLAGGNLAVLNGLSSTPFDILTVRRGEDTVLFMEDIAEPIYKIDRVLTRLYMAGTLSHIKGLVIGQFTEYRPDANFRSVEDMINARLAEWHLDRLPVVFGFPCGHVDGNLPLVEGSYVSIDIDAEGVTFTMSYPGED